MYAVILAAGNSSRFGTSTPKQFLYLRSVLDKFLSIDEIKGVICVIPDRYGFDFPQREKLIFVVGGNSRQESVKNGLEVIAQFHPSYVLIHDAARPYCSCGLIKNVMIKLYEGNKAVVPSIRPVDSVRVDGIGVNRNSIALVQTPQGFDFELLYKLHKKYQNQNMSDDASLFDLEGVEVSLIEGEHANRKITFKNDLPGAVSRVGFGFDSHAFSTDSSRKLKLCGIEIANITGLEGVSDADVAIHSLIDAILGATGRGSIGERFPVDSETSRDADSIELLKKIMSGSFDIINVDMTIICEQPNIVQYRNIMEQNIASNLGIDQHKVNVKGKTTEGTNIEGIAAYSSVLVSLYEEQ